MQNSLPSVKNRALGKDLLCRVLHSAKNCTRQRVFCRVPGTRQTRALGKGLLCRVPDPRQNLYTRHRLPAKRCSVTAFFAECLLLGTRERFDFFLKKIFAECPRSGTRQRFNLFFKILCRASQIWRSAKKIFLFLKYFAECPLDGTRPRFNFFLLFLCRVLLWMHSAKRKF